MKTHSKVLFMALAALVLLAGCKKQSSEKRITKFAFTSLNVEAAVLRQPYNPNAGAVGLSHRGSRQKHSRNL